MPKRLIKRFTPTTEELHKSRWLRIVGPFLFNPLLWHLHRRSVARATAVGCFSAFIPAPVQMFIAAILAILLRANVPVSVTLVWISNPFTFAPILYMEYKIGTWFLGAAPVKLSKFTPSLSWMLHELSKIWQPLFLGSIVCGVISAAVGYIIVRLAWRWWVVKQWRRRGLR